MHRRVVPDDTQLAWPIAQQRLQKGHAISPFHRARRPLKIAASCGRDGADHHVAWRLAALAFDDRGLAHRGKRLLMWGAKVKARLIDEDQRFAPSVGLFFLILARVALASGR